MTDPNFERSLRAAARRGPAGRRPSGRVAAGGLRRSRPERHRAHPARGARRGLRRVHGATGAARQRERPRRAGGAVFRVVAAAAAVSMGLARAGRDRRGAGRRLGTAAVPPGLVRAGIASSAGLSRRQSRRHRTRPKTRRTSDRWCRSRRLSARQVSPRRRSARSAEASKAKDASARPELQAGAREGAPRRAAPPSGGAAADEFALRDKKELDAVNPPQADKVAAAPAPAAAAAKPVQTEAAASVAGRADEAKARNQPQALATPSVPETVAQGALLKSAIEAPLVVASGPGVSIRRSGTRLERSTDNGATWAVDLADAPAGLHVGSCPTTAVCWLGGSQGIVLVRQASGSWTRHVVADGRAAVIAIQAADALAATVSLSDGRRFQTADAGVTWLERK